MEKNKYFVEFCYGDHSEWTNEIEDYDTALNFACVSSELLGVSETRVWCENEIVAVYVDGEEKDNEIDYEYDEPYDPFDEVGYDPYGGCFDMDL